jgi:hypothetical protein
MRDISDLKCLRCVMAVFFYENVFVLYEYQPKIQIPVRKTEPIISHLQVEVLPFCPGPYVIRFIHSHL